MTRSLAFIGGTVLLTLSWSIARADPFRCCGAPGTCATFNCVKVGSDYIKTGDSTSFPHCITSVHEANDCDDPFDVCASVTIHNSTPCVPENIIGYGDSVMRRCDSGDDPC